MPSQKCNYPFVSNILDHKISDFGIFFCPIKITLDRENNIFTSNFYLISRKQMHAYFPSHRSNLNFSFFCRVRGWPWFLCVKTNQICGNWSLAGMNWFCFIFLTSISWNVTLNKFHWESCIYIDVHKSNNEIENYFIFSKTNSTLGYLKEKGRWTKRHNWNFCIIWENLTLRILENSS